jgi:glycosyltransferase involved in cell wall biosynthesis
MRFSIVTPCFQSSNWLKLCIASVADQGVPVEHIVQDAGSTDGTLDWLGQDPRVRLFVERDTGMYDAINRGFARAQGDVLAYLNCDEQYLPGALAAVADYFRAHPAVDVVFGDFVVVNARGEYLFHRKVQPPLRHHLQVSHLPTYSCGMFFRRHLISEQQILFNPQLKAVGDGDWVLRLLERGVRMAVLRRFTSVFTLHESNLGNSPAAVREASEMHARAPVWVRALKPWWLSHHRLRRWAGGMYRQAPFTFQLYTPELPQRIERRVVRPSGRWAPPKPRDE